MTPVDEGSRRSRSSCSSRSRSSGASLMSTETMSASRSPTRSAAVSPAVYQWYESRMTPTFEAPVSAISSRTSDSEWMKGNLSVDQNVFGPTYSSPSRRPGVGEHLRHQREPADVQHPVAAVGEVVVHRSHPGADRPDARGGQHGPACPAGSRPASPNSAAGAVRSTGSPATPHRRPRSATAAAASRTAASSPWEAKWSTSAIEPSETVRDGQFDRRREVGGQAEGAEAQVRVHGVTLGNRPDASGSRGQACASSPGSRLWCAANSSSVIDRVCSRVHWAAVSGSTATAW